MRPSLLLTPGARRRGAGGRGERRRRGRPGKDAPVVALRDDAPLEAGSAAPGSTATPTSIPAAVSTPAAAPSLGAAPATAAPATATPATATASSPAPASAAADAEAQRARAAGGPLDEAIYTCGCGCLFAAAVTTSVACPHCGGEQAW